MTLNSKFEVLEIGDRIEFRTNWAICLVAGVTILLTLRDLLQTAPEVPVMIAPDYFNDATRWDNPFVTKEPGANLANSVPSCSMITLI
jgi:hypothetical protein